MDYEPGPIDTSDVTLTEELRKLTELLAKNAHDIWARQRLAEGWTYGPKRDDAKREHPCLVPYEELPESEKQYDRNAAMETLKAILVLGYQIASPTPNSSPLLPLPLTHQRQMSRLRKNPAFAVAFDKRRAQAEVAFQIRRLREAKGWTQQDLAKKVNCSQQAISAIEQAGYTCHSLPLLRRIAEALDADVLVALVPRKAA